MSEEDKSPNIVSLVFRKDGLHARQWVPPIFEKNDEGKEIKIKEGYYEVVPLELEDEFDILGSLRHGCEIEKGTTLRSIMDYVRRNKWLCIFLKKYSWAHGLDEYHAQLDDPPEKSECIKRLEIQWFPETHYTEDGKPKGENAKVPEVNLHHNFSGRGPAGEEAKHWDGDPNDEISYGFGGGNIKDILDLPIVIREEVEFEQVDFKKKKDEKLERIVMFKGEAGFTLLEILDAIYWEISFYGPPCESKAIFDNVCEMRDEYLKQEEEKDGMETEESN